jgi:hypothetical protein
MVKEEGKEGNKGASSQGHFSLWRSGERSGNGRGDLGQKRFRG